jgi:hypothetical protein
MSDTIIRNALEADFARIVQLNETEVQYTSIMDAARLCMLDQLAAYHKVAIVDGQVAAFMFAMRDGSNYINPNFSWFAARLDSFIYIDRIVVDAGFAGRKIGSAMYQDLFNYARNQNIKNIVCEYNVEPPNLASQSFHAKWGFKEIGSHWLDGGAKRVSLQAAQI